ncbi:oligosaccharide flippase family protein [bacterium]|nr:oligosaccharide flippase family protein [bacterium]
MIKERLLSFVPVGNREFLSHAKNYAFATLITKGIGFLLIPIMTRLLTPSEYGILSVFGSIVSVSLIIIGFGIPGAVNRYYHEKTNDFKEYLGTNVFFLFVAGGIWFILLLSFQHRLSKIFNFNPKLLLLAFVVATMGVFYQVYLYYLNAKKKSALYARMQIIKGTSLPIMSIIWITLLTYNRYMGAIYSNLVIGFVMAVLSIYILLKNSKFKFNIKHVWYSLKFGIPWIPHALSGFVLSYFDRIIINQLNGAKDAGLYSFAYNVGMVLYIIVMAFSKSWNPIFYEKMNQKKFKDINDIASANNRIIVAIAVFLILFSKEIAMLMANNRYYNAFGLIPIIVVSYVFVFIYTLYVNFSFYRKKTYLISLNTFLAGAINIVLNYCFIPKYGYKIAAITTLFSYIILLILHYVSVTYILKERVIVLRTLLLDVLWVVFYLAIFYFTFYFISGVLISLAVKIVLLIPYLFYLFRKIGENSVKNIDS